MAWLLLLVALAMLAVAVDLWVALIVLGVIALGLLAAWIFSPWRNAARNLVLPDRETFDARVEGSRRAADAIGRVPVFGSVWRAAQRWTQRTVDDGIDRQRAIIDEEHRREGR